MNDNSGSREAIQRIGQLAAVGRLDEAWAECKALVSRAPGDSSGWTLFGQLSLQRGLLSDAEMAFRQVANLSPRDASAWNWLSIAQRGQGRLAEAEASARQAIAIDPSPAIHWTNLANALALQAKWDQAAAAFRESLARQPGDAENWSGLGVALWKLGDLAGADDAYQRALDISKDHLPTITNYARLLLDRQQPEKALQVLDYVLTCDPLLVNAWVAMGDAYLVAGDQRKASNTFWRALELAPADSALRMRIAATLAANGLTSDAEPLVERIVNEHPQSAESWAMVGLLRERQVRLPEADEALRRSLELSPNPQHHSSLLGLVQYACGMSPELLLQLHRQWDEIYAAPLLPNAPPVVPNNSGRPLRLGFVSAHFTRHPTSFLALSALENMEGSRCSVVCYSDSEKEDGYTSRWRALSQIFRRTASSSDQDLAQQVREDRIDILFDFMGHSGKRLLVFARNPAPVQISWIGYVGTTGMRAMDYVLADRFHIRPDEECHFAEAVLRMPNDYACYAPPADAPDVGRLPGLDSGQVTFGSFNNPAKISPPTISAWAEILKRVPESRLLLKYRGFEQEQLQDRIKAEFAQRLIVPQRLILEGHSPPSELLQAYSRVDIALDTQPYSGGLTTCEALWMGVPTITFPGGTFAGRHATSHMTNASFGHFVADDVSTYIELAVDWSKRLDELTRVRSIMREEVSRSALCDAPQFAADLLRMLDALQLK